MPRGRGPPASSTASCRTSCSCRGCASSSGSSTAASSARSCRCAASSATGSSKATGRPRSARRGTTAPPTAAASSWTCSRTGSMCWSSSSRRSAPCRRPLQHTSRPGWTRWHAVRGDRRRRRLRHVRARGRHRRADQLLVGGPGPPGRAGRVPGRRHPRQRRRGPAGVPRPAPRHDPEAGVEPRPAGHRALPLAVAAGADNERSTTASRCSGSCSCATSWTAPTSRWDFAAGARGVQLAELGLQAAREGRRIEYRAVVTGTRPVRAGLVRRRRASPSTRPRRNVGRSTDLRGCAPQGVSQLGLWRTRSTRSASTHRRAGPRGRHERETLCRGGFFPRPAGWTTTGRPSTRRRRWARRCSSWSAAASPRAAGTWTPPGARSAPRSASSSRMPRPPVYDWRSSPCTRCSRPTGASCPPWDRPGPRGTVPASVVGVAVDTYHLWWDDQVWTQSGRAGAGRIACFQVADWITPLPEGVLLGRGCPARAEWSCADSVRRWTPPATRRDRGRGLPRGRLVPPRCGVLAESIEGYLAHVV